MRFLPQRSALASIWSQSKKHYIATVVILALGVFLSWSALASLRDGVNSYLSNRADQKSEQAVKVSLGAAATHEQNANTISVDRQIKEDRAARAQERKIEAAERSEKTLAPTRQAKRRYEETRNTPTSALPPIPDDRICAELAKRDIPCQ